ncbi:hypothetical protein [Denitromonas iodatirespirans]|uniref:Uncharacterized protein n=1 Tax=Denitromonas iodatirespirans TaxID=2795389 RepID=A0A944D4J9_DENI1|nr:hypothetical protein [Denitromonas iodatirespirans]MBT0959895.1 hypothetical protein [Denitromonas iodatirespirans]
MANARPWLAGLWVGWAMLAGSAMAAEATVGPGGPPVSYRLDSVRLVVAHAPGRVAGAPARRLALSGGGPARLVVGEAAHTFAYPADALLSALNGLYRLHFFALPPDLTRRPSVFLKDDGSIGTSLLRLADRPVTTLCVYLADYEKCVRFTDDGPEALRALVNQLDADADRRVAAEPPG